MLQSPEVGIAYNHTINERTHKMTLNLLQESLQDRKSCCNGQNLYARLGHLTFTSSATCFFHICPVVVSNMFAKLYIYLMHHFTLARPLLDLWLYITPVFPVGMEVLIAEL